MVLKLRLHCQHALLQYSLFVYFLCFFESLSKEGLWSNLSQFKASCVKELDRTIEPNTNNDPPMGGCCG